MLENYIFEDFFGRLPQELRTALENMEQNPKWHAEGPVSEHVRLVFNIARDKYKDLNLMVASVFHDLGKIDATTVIVHEGKEYISSKGHADFATKYIDELIHLFEDLDIDVDLIKFVCAHHMRAHRYRGGKLIPNFTLEDLEDSPYFDKLMEFGNCDEDGRIEEDLSYKQQ